MSVEKTVVIKLGGSLLDWEDMPRQFHTWLNSNCDSRKLIVVGGGELVDVYREFAERESHDEVTAHWRCIQLMSQTAVTASDKLGIPVTTDINTNEAIAILDVHDWLQKKQSVPCSWDVTSDSITAIVATDVEANELVLMKSTLPASATCEVFETVPDKWLGNFVDRFFGEASRRYIEGRQNRIRFVNLRNIRFDECCVGTTETKTLAES